MTDQSTRVKLKGDSAQSSHTIEVQPNGTLVAELYDFSDAAEQSCGGDIALGVTVAKESLPHLLSSLRKEPMFQRAPTEASPEDQIRELLPMLSRRFDDYHAFKSWLAELAIPFSEYSDPFA